MSAFLVIYGGGTVETARLVSVSADPVLVAEVAARMLAERQAAAAGDEAADALLRGRREALRIIAGDSETGPRRGDALDVELVSAIRRGRP